MGCQQWERAVELAAQLANRHNREGFDAAEWALDFFGFGSSTFGAESVRCECADVGMEYLNAGNTCDLTVCHEDGGKFFASSWGDWLEGVEREYDTENDTVGCAWCSHHTPVERDDWRSTTCENCGKCVSG